MGSQQPPSSDWIKTTCPYCGVGCGIEARPSPSKGLEIRGDPEHPANYGKLCTKGLNLGETVIPDGRLLAPTLVKSQTELSWQHATELVAEKFSQAIAEHGPDSVAFYVSGQLLTEDYYLANKLMKGFIGSANIDSNSRLCMASSVVGHKRAFGQDVVPVCYEDLEQADCVVLVGSNLAWCHPVLYQRLRSAKQANPQLKMVLIDPIKSASAELCDWHLPLHSGSDVALFNGLLAWLWQHDYGDLNFIANHTEHLEAALDLAQQQTQQQAHTEQLTGLSTEQLNEFYQVFAQSDKVVTVYSQGVNQSSSGVDKVNSIINCHLLTGKIGKLGCGPFSVTGQPNAMGGREVGALANTLAGHIEFGQVSEAQALQDFWQSPQLANKPGLTAVELFHAMQQGKIKALWIMATNPMVSLPDSAQVKAALEHCPFVVVSDCIAETDTTAMADLLLPAQGWSEKSGTVTNSERRISRQRRLLPSPELAKPDWWIIQQVAQKMGFAEQFNYRHEGEIFAEHAKLTSLHNQHNERALDLSGLADLSEQQYFALSPQQWPVQQLQPEIVQQRLFAGSAFFTTSGRAQFVPVQHQTAKSHCTPEYPLLLNTGRSKGQWHTMTRSGLSANLAEQDAVPYVWIHPDTAAHYQLEDGQWARLDNGRGSVIARAQISEHLEPKQLFMPIHWSETHAKHAKPCTLIAPWLDPHSKQPEFKHTPVQLTPCSFQTSAVLLCRAPLPKSALAPWPQWLKQKISAGYLYRFESNLAQDEMIRALQQLELGQAGGRLWEAQQAESYRYLSAGAERLEWLWQVQSSLDEPELKALIELFNQPSDVSAWLKRSA